MTDNSARQYRIGNKFLFHLFAVPLFAAILYGQPAGDHFETASIRPTPFPSDEYAAGFLAGSSRNPCSGGKISVSGTLVTLTRVGICDIIRIAYDLRNYQVVGVPPALGTSGLDKTDESPSALSAKGVTFFYDIVARAPGSETPSPEQVRAMFRALLSDRFQLAVHREKRNLPFYALVPQQGGPKLTEAVASCKPIPSTEVMKVCGQTMEQIARYLSGFADRTVLNMTGVAGRFDYEIPIDKGTDFGPSLLARVQGYLKLRLEPRTGPIEVLVVDHLERPSEN